MTLCAYKMLHLFGKLTDGKVLLSPIGHIIEICWRDIPTHFNFVELDAFVVMPNHVHGILLIKEQVPRITMVGATYDGFVGAKHASPLQLSKGGHGSPPGSLSAIIASFKSSVTRIARSTLHFQGPLWQRSFYDHILRNEQDWATMHAYILANPSNWPNDPVFGG